MLEFDPYEYLEDIQSNAVINWALSESRGFSSIGLLVGFIASSLFPCISLGLHNH
ncbi:MAG: hypothetical protein QXO91_03350 [Desulfurococcaceae archaeon]